MIWSRIDRQVWTRAATRPPAPEPQPLGDRLRQVTCRVRHDANSLFHFGVVAHEFTEIMGRELNAVGNTAASGPGDHPLDLFKFSAAGAHEFVGTNAGYFSVDGGTTNLDNSNMATSGTGLPVREPIRFSLSARPAW